MILFFIYPTAYVASTIHLGNMLLGEIIYLVTLRVVRLI